MRIALQRGARRAELDVTPVEGGMRVTRDGGESVLVTVVHRDATTLVLEIDGRRHRVRHARDARDLHLAIGGHAARLHRIEEEEADDLDVAAGSPVVRAPMPGRVLEILVAEGDGVEAGQAVARVEAMKMEVSLVTAVAGTVERVHVAPEDLVQPEAAIVTIAPAATD